MLKITQPRIYFGIKNNDLIIVNSKDEIEYDYPMNSVQNYTNKYDGDAGIKLNILDRFILGLKENNLRIIYDKNINKESKIITNRNIIKRAQKIMPYLTYDDKPYLLITDSGRLVWVLDAYTKTNNYPYSQESTLKNNGDKEKINYIRNSVKVLIDAYDGNMEFYITDRTDPIVMAYRNMYPSLFENLNKTIQKDIQKNITYSEKLYSIQSKILSRYHDVKIEVFYRGDDVWDIAKENKTNIITNFGTEIEPYYTLVKDTNGNNILGLIIPYTEKDKQNLKSYLVGIYNNNKLILNLYKFGKDDIVLGTNQLNNLAEQDNRISAELKKLDTIGTKTIKNIYVIPINNTVIYIEPIYQIMLNESKVPLLKKVIVASGNKVSIGNNLKEALENLLSQDAINIQFDIENEENLITEIINVNKKLEKSKINSDWEMMGKDMNELQTLIKQLEIILNKDTNKTKGTIKEEIEKLNILNI